jgi:hypothetical protein
MLTTCGNDIIIYCIGISIFVPQCPRENGDIGGLSPTQKGEYPFYLPTANPEEPNFSICLLGGLLRNP